MGTTEIIFILLIYLLLFGAKGMPSLARSLGSAVRQFRSATDEIQREILATDAQPRRRKPTQSTEATPSDAQKDRASSNPENHTE
jgi:sec-independent protein translocase protein TatA